MKPIPLSGAALVLAIAVAGGQSPRKIAFRTLCLQPLPGLTELSLPAATSKGDAVPVALYAGALSPVLEGTFKGNDAVFFPAAADTAAKTPAARGKLAKSKQQLLLFLPSTTAQGTPSYEIRAFDDDTDSFKLGSIRAINLTASPIRFILAGEAMPSIRPSEHAQYLPTKKADEYGMYAVGAEIQGEGESWTQTYSASWKTSDRRREIVVVQMDDETKQPTVKLVNDDPPWQD